MKKPEITGLLLLSTAHIPPAVAAALGEDFAGTDQEGIEPAEIGEPAVYEMDGYGYMVWVPSTPDLDYALSTNEVLANIQRYARNLGCAYVWLDRDGQTIDDL